MLSMDNMQALFGLAASLLLRLVLATAFYVCASTSIVLNLSIPVLTSKPSS